MINYFAGGADLLVYDIIKNHLIAWIDRSQVKLRQQHFTKDSNVMFDSGAFTAFTTGKKIDINEYAEFIKNYILIWEKKIKSLNFINLDVIGDSEKSWENQHKLEKLNVNTIPVIHHGGFKKKYLDKALKEYNYFAFGGLVGKNRKKQILPFLDYCFRLIFTHVKKGNKLPKVHLLGVADPKVLYRYPAFSCDSTAYMSVNRFGISRFLKLTTLPKGGLKRNKIPYKFKNKYKYDREKDRRILRRVMIYEIKQYHKLERAITAFWKKKGVVFNE